MTSEPITRMEDSNPGTTELQENFRAYEEQLPRLLVGNKGRYAVGRAGTQFTCWDTYSDANKFGYLCFGQQSFLIQKVTEIPEVKTLSRELSLRR